MKRNLLRLFLICTIGVFTCSTVLAKIIIPYNIPIGKQGGTGGDGTGAGREVVAAPFSIMQDDGDYLDIYFDFDFTAHMELSIVDTGGIILSETYDTAALDSQVFIDISTLAPGTYSLAIILEGDPTEYFADIVIE